MPADDDDGPSRVPSPASYARSAAASSAAAMPTRSDGSAAHRTLWLPPGHERSGLRCSANGQPAASVSGHRVADRCVELVVPAVAGAEHLVRFVGFVVVVEAGDDSFDRQARSPQVANVG